MLRIQNAQSYTQFFTKKLILLFFNDTYVFFFSEKHGTIVLECLSSLFYVGPGSNPRHLIRNSAQKRVERTTEEINLVSDWTHPSLVNLGEYRG